MLTVRVVFTWGCAGVDSLSSMGHRVAAVVLGIVVVGGVVPDAGAQAGGVRVLGEQVVEHDLEFEATVVGGLSGINYLSSSGEFVFSAMTRRRRALRGYTRLEFRWGRTGSVP